MTLHARHLRALKLLAGASGGLLVALLLAAWLVPQYLDWTRYRDGIAAIASARLGRVVRLRGDVSLRLLPQAVLEADGVTLADRGDGVSATIGALRLRVAVWPLVWGRLVPQRLELDDPVVTLPWPLPRGAAPAPGRVPQSFSARIEGGVLHAGRFLATGLTGNVLWDPGSGALAAYGNVQLGGMRWRLSARVGSPGPGGASPLDIALDGEGAAAGTGGGLRGQLLANGTIEGDAAAEGRDLARLLPMLPVPSLAWQADGVLRLTSGHVRAPRVAFTLGGVAGDGALDVALGPALAADVTLHTARLAPGAWLAGMARAHAALPLRLAWAVDEIPVPGGTLRGAHGTALLGPGAAHVTAEAAPGAKSVLTLSADGTPEGGLRGTLALGAAAGKVLPGWIGGWWPGAAAMLGESWPEFSLRAGFALDRGGLALSGVTMAAGAVTAQGAARLDAGARPVLTAQLALGALALPDAALGAAARHLAALITAAPPVDATLDLSAESLSLGKLTLRAPRLHGSATASGVALRQFSAFLPGGQISASGALGSDGAVADAVADFAVADAAAVHVPQALALVPPGLWHGPAHLHAEAAGPARGVLVRIGAELADLRAWAALDADMQAPGIQGEITLRHPGAARFLAEAGLDAHGGWIGEGSLSATGHAAWRPGLLAWQDVAVAAGDVQGGGAGTLSWEGGQAAIAARLHAANAILPPLETLAAWLPAWLHGTVQVTTGRLWVSPHLALDDARGVVQIAGGDAAADDVSFTLAGGAATGDAAVDGGHWALGGTVQGARAEALMLPGPKLLGGMIDMQLNLSGGAGDVSGGAQAMLHDVTLAAGTPPRPASKRHRAGADAAILGPLNGPVSLTGEGPAAVLQAAPFTTSSGTVSLSGGWAPAQGGLALQALVTRRPPRPGRATQPRP